MGRYRKIAGIYIITNILDNKKYVGSSKNIKKRWDGHKNSLRRNSHRNRHLQSAWNKYGEKNFVFSIIEQMSLDLTKVEYEKVETKWILYFKTHLSEYGYNSCLPGTIPLCNEGENKTQRPPLPIYVCINIETREIIHMVGREKTSIYTGIPISKITEIASYWRGKGRRKSLHNWIVVREEDYNTDFDYIGYKKQRKYKYGRKLTQGDYYWIKKAEGRTKYKKKEPIPYEERKLKRTPILAVNISTGEETIYPMLKDCCKYFLQNKVRKCINSPFGTHQHRGHYFKRLNREG